MKHKNIRITSIFILVLSIVISTYFASCGGSKFKYIGKRVIVLGIDGMDPNILRDFMNRGYMPNFSRLVSEGFFTELTTSQPPQSPVAWSNFITGMDPGGHGIFDFIHREPETMNPYLSTSITEPPSSVLKIGKYRIPLKGGDVKLLRKGQAFWQILEEHGIPSVVFKIPANFPPAESEAKTFSGMGTPDLQGGYGVLTFFTDDSSLYKEDVGGVKVTMVEIQDEFIQTEIGGPYNSLVKDNPQVFVPLNLYLDMENELVRIEAQDNDFLLYPGEWSDWAELDFPLLKPFASAKGIVRFYLKQVQPSFQLYCSPVNISPSNPALPISTPPSYAKELSRHLGNFFTLGIPEDTKALSEGIFGFEEYLSQAKLVLEERLREFDYTWSNFEDGLYFFYFSSLDQNSHTLWSTFDPESPIYDTEVSMRFGKELLNFYMEIDKVLGRVLDEMQQDDLLLIMSDHGFVPFRYCFDLNTWLLENGYLTIRDESRRMEGYFAGVHWRKTKAYGLGINGLYLNLKGREKYGTVSPHEAEELKDELISKLEAIIDPKTGEKVISAVWKREDIYHGPEMENAPDLIVGYNRGYRASWDTVLGKFPQHIISDNQDKWAGDHCVDNRLVPGVLLSNRIITKHDPALYDLTPTILAEFGISIPPDMVGRSIFK